MPWSSGPVLPNTKRIHQSSYRNQILKSGCPDAVPIPIPAQKPHVSHENSSIRLQQLGNCPVRLACAPRCCLAVRTSQPVKRKSEHRERTTHGHESFKGPVLKRLRLMRSSRIIRLFLTGLLSPIQSSCALSNCSCVGPRCSLW